MKQFTKQQAIAFEKSGEWKDWTSEDVVKLQLYQNKLCVPFEVFHKSIEEVLGRPVFTHEFGLNRQGLMNEFEGNCATPTFEETMNLISEEKRIVIGI